jgi:hypothetical protein
MESLLAVHHKLHAADEAIKILGNLTALSASSSKGIVHRALDT